MPVYLGDKPVTAIRKGIAPSNYTFKSVDHYGDEGNDSLNAGGFRPPLVADLIRNIYYKHAMTAKFSDIISGNNIGGGTMVDSDGKLKWAPHNLLLRSQGFSTAPWSSGVELTISGSDIPAPDGTMTAFQVVKGGISQISIVQGSVVATGQTKAIWARVRSGTATVALTGYYNYAKYQKTLTDEWQLFEIPSDASETGGTAFYAVDMRFGTATEVHIWGAHLYRSDLGGMVNNPKRSDSYVPTTSAAVYLPRRNHHVWDGSAWVNKGLRHESEARTNVCVRSSDFSVTWALTNGGVTVAQTPNATIAPDGTMTATKISDTESVKTGPHDAAQAVNYTGTVTATAFFKAAEKSIAAIRTSDLTTGGYAALFNLTTGTAYLNGVSKGTATNGVCSMENVGGGWWRCRLTQTFNSGIGHATGFGGSTTTASTDSTSNNGDGIYVWGAQVEQAATPSSYIPTSNVTATRAANPAPTILAANMPWPSVQYIGADLVPNGKFTSDTIWNKGVGWSISDGAAHIIGGESSADLVANIGVVDGKVYEITFDILSISANGRIFVLSPTLSNTAFTTVGTKKRVVVSSAARPDQLSIRALSTDGSPMTASISNAEVREIKPLAVSIQLEGMLSYADTNVRDNAVFLQWQNLEGFRITWAIMTDGASTGKMEFQQYQGTTYTQRDSSITAFSPGINVPFNLSGRHTSITANGAVNGVALTENVADLPDLLVADFKLGTSFMGIISKLRVWDEDIGNAGIAEASA